MSSWIVGMDGSADAEHALRWAVAQAVDRPIALTAVTAWSVPTIPVEAGAVLVPNMFEVEQSYLRRLERQIAAVDTRGMAITATVAEGSPAGVLLDASAGAELLVVGGRGVGRFRGALLGSVSQRCVNHATVPVAVIPSDAGTEPTARVVVGFDQSEHAANAVRWALDFCAPDVAITVLGAFALAPWLQEDVVREHHPREVDDAERQFREALAALDPQGRVTPSFVLADPRYALSIAAHEADLVVLGARGSGAIRAALIGSVTSWMLHAATRATVVVH
ncbi:MAG: universal stress protein [Ilumatobacteraceae bacterium]|jgi:nucleotide-binding universal stress UspA family protein